MTHLTRTLTTADGASLHVVVIATDSLGDRTYVLHDGTHAAVVDPQRDVDRVLTVLDDLGLTLGAILDTHVHNDYVSGGLELARRTGASYHLNADDPAAYARTPISDGDVVTAGAIELRAVLTPGHTPTHLSYVVARDGEELAVCTGGGLLFGSVGRTDLIDEARTEELTRAQYRSAHALADQLPGTADVLPTHGFGSFCSSGDVAETDASTIGEERSRNDALAGDDEDAFVRSLMAGLDEYPAYYARMGPLNLAGPNAADLSPAVEVDGTELAARLHAGEWVVDLRDRRTFAAGHLAGTLNVELADSASTHLGWLLPAATPLLLIAESADDVAAFQRQLVRIGIDRPQGRTLTEDIPGMTSTYDVTDFAGAAALLAEDDTALLLDARRDGERAEGHVEGSVHVPLHHLLARLGDVPDGRVLVHCASGYRASIGASLLARAGRTVTLVDDDVDKAREAGLPWTTS